MQRAVGSIVLVIVLFTLVACHRKGRTSNTEPTTDETGGQLVPVTIPNPGDSPRLTAADPRPVPDGQGALSAKDLFDLHLEVTALEVMAQLQLTRPQLELLARLARTTAGKKEMGHSLQGSEELRKVMTDLHAALIAEDEDSIADLSARLEELRDKEGIDAPEVEITQQARQHTPQLLQTLGARQIALYLADYAEDFPDPVEKLTAALEEVREAKGKEADPLRDDIAAQMGWLLAGLDSGRAKAAAERVRGLLTRARQLSDSDFQAQHEQLLRWTPFARPKRCLP